MVSALCRAIRLFAVFFRRSSAGLCCSASVRPFFSTSYVRILRDNPSFGQLRALYTPEGIKRYDSRMREFLSGWLGGPALYQERHGLPMLRESHRAIPIDRALMQEWMRVMRMALNEAVADPALRLRLEGAFARMSESLINQR